MSRLGWWLVDIVSLALDADERDAVRGDFTETGEFPGRALQDVLGLVVRRQVALWCNWPPWLAFLGVVVVAGVPVTLFWVWLSNNLVVRLMVLIHDGSVYESALPIRQDTFAMLCQCAALASWLWTTGFALGSVSRRTAWITGPLFYLLWLSPVVVPMFQQSPQLILPWLTLQLVFTVPSALGLNHGLRVHAMKRRHAAVVAAWTVGVALLSLWTRGWGDTAMKIWSRGAIEPQSITWESCAMAAACCWPAAYLAFVAEGRTGPGCQSEVLSPEP